MRNRIAGRWRAGGAVRKSVRRSNHLIRIIHNIDVRQRDNIIAVRARGGGDANEMTAESNANVCRRVVHNIIIIRAPRLIAARVSRRRRVV